MGKALVRVVKNTLEADDGWAEAMKERIVQHLVEKKGWHPVGDFTLQEVERLDGLDDNLPHFMVPYMSKIEIPTLDADGAGLNLYRLKV